MCDIFEQLSVLIIDEANDVFTSQLRHVMTSSEQQFNVDDVDDDGRTLLYVAAQHGNAFAARLLISNGANIEARNDTGYTPLHIAAEAGKPETLEYCLQNNANLNNIENSWGSSPIICASFWGFSLVFEC